MALKAAILPPIFLGALILFLFAGAGFFTCSIINCQRLVGDIAGGGGPSFGPGFGGLPPYSPFSKYVVNIRQVSRHENVIRKYKLFAFKIFTMFSFF